MKKVEIAVFPADQFGKQYVNKIRVNIRYLNSVYTS